jgi:hypothetical protein
MSSRLLNYFVMRKNIKNLIDEDPWTITRYREGKHAGDAETTGVFTGRVFGNTERGFLEANPANMSGERGWGRYRWAVIGEYNLPGGLVGRDELRCVHVATGTQLILRLIVGQWYTHKWEGLCDELQP